MKNHTSFLFFALILAMPSAFAQRNIDSILKKKSAKIQYGTASFYAGKFQGRKTAIGEPYDQNKMTCAHNSLPLGIWVKVTNLRNHKSVYVRVTDRLHHKNKRLVDLSRAAAAKLGYLKRGLTRVKVEVLSRKPPLVEKKLPKR